MRIVSILKKYRIKKKLKTNKDHITYGNDTFLINNFNFRLTNPTPKKKYIEIGSECLIEGHFIFERETGQIKVGDRVHIGGGTKLISINSIEIGNDVTMAWGITLYDHNSHSIYWSERSDDTPSEIRNLKAGRNFIADKNWDVVKSAPIKIEDKVWIGFDVTILKGVTIGEGSVIGAKSVVYQDVPPYSVVIGNPARVVKTIQENNEK